MVSCAKTYLFASEWILVEEPWLKIPSLKKYPRILCHSEMIGHVLSCLCISLYSHSTDLVSGGRYLLHILIENRYNFAATDAAKRRVRSVNGLAADQ